MKMMKKSILALGVVALAAANSYAAGIGTNTGTDGFGIYKRVSGTDIIDLDAAKLTAAGISIEGNSVVGQNDFGQWKIKDKNGNTWWYTAMESKDSVKGNVKQEVYVRSSSDGAMADMGGASFRQALIQGTADGTDAWKCSFSAGNDCVGTHMSYDGIQVGGVSDRDFSIDFTMVEKGAGTSALPDYRQHFGFEQKEANTRDDAFSMDCYSFETGTSTGCGNGTKSGKPLEKVGSKIQAKATFNTDGKPNIGQTLSHVFFEDAARIGSGSTAAPIGFKFESADIDPSETGVTDNDYRFQTF